jgi:hypothetical protein
MGRVRCIAWDIDQTRVFVVSFTSMDHSTLNFVKLYPNEYEHCECDFWAPTTTEVPGWVGLT